MSNSRHDQQPPPPTCFSALLRRLLCSGSLPTHPSDHLTTTNTTTTSDSTHHEKLIVPSKTINISQQNHLQNPNIVARLMGLDSLPDPSILTRRRRSLDSFLRSKSVNHVDFLPHFEEASKHRRVRTSVSFREVSPKLLNDRDRDFFVLCFDEGDRKARKPEPSFILLKEHNVVRGDGTRNVSNKVRDKKVAKKREKSTVKRNEVSSNAVMIKPSFPKVLGDHDLEKKLCRKSNANSKKVYGKEKVEMKTSSRLERRKERHNRVHMNKNSIIVSTIQNPIPVEDTATVSDENSCGRRLTSRNKPSSKSNIQKYDDPCPKLVSRLHIERDDVEQGQSGTNSPAAYKKLQERRTCDYANVLKQACSVTEDHIKGYDIWFVNENVLSFENFEEICVVVGRQILDVLVHQLVEELCSSFECYET